MNTNGTITNATQSDSLPSQPNALLQVDSRNYDLIKIHETGTIFNIAEFANGTDENCCITLGKKRLTELMTYEKCEQRIIQKDWDLILCLITIGSEISLYEIAKQGSEQIKNSNQ